MEKKFGIEEVIKGRLDAMELVEKRMEREHRDAICCFSLFIIALALWNIFVALWADFSIPLTKKQLTVGVEILSVLMLLYVLFRTRFRLRDMGFDTKNIGPVLLRDGIISVACIAILAVANLIVNKGTLVCNFKKFDFFYLLTAPLQEFLARGFLLNCLLKIYTGRHGTAIALLVSCFLFMSLHIYYGFTFMIGAGVLSLLLGLLFLKDRCIWGVSLIHFMIGNAWFVLGFVK